MKPCVICKKEFEEKDLDFLERCFPCFHKWMAEDETTRQKINKPFVPIYNGGK